MDAMVPDEVTRRVLARYESGGLITACAWCRRIDLDDDWALAPRSALAAIDELNSLTHSICPSCLGRLAGRAAA